MDQPITNHSSGLSLRFENWVGGEKWRWAWLKVLAHCKNNIHSKLLVSLTCLLCLACLNCISKSLFFTVTSLSHFLAYLGQFKSKSHIQGHPQKVENRTFHLPPSLIGFQVLLFDILASKRGARFVDAPCRCQIWHLTAVGTLDDGCYVQRPRSVLGYVGSRQPTFWVTRTSGRSAPLVLVPVPHTPMLVTTPNISQNPWC